MEVNYFTILYWFWHTPMVFSNELALCIRWPKYWSFNFNISPSNENPGLISFRMDWLEPPSICNVYKDFIFCDNCQF